jgi:HAD superfamily hydrolase (TIGR01509 family)
MIKALVFDCFGVLATDGWTPFKVQHIAPNSDLERTIAAVGRQSDTGRLSAEETTRRMAELIGVGEEVLKAALSDKVTDGMLFEFIKTELKPKYKIGLMSNGNYDITHELFNEEQMKLFDASVLSYDTNLAKPDEAMYKLAAERLRVNLSECLFVDDKQPYVTAARAYGAPALLYTELVSFKQDLPKILQN